ncbi:MAG: cellulase family glycosylhydrolase [Gaiellaceae bacterium]
MLACAPVAAGAPLAVPAQLRLVNYFPARNGWTYMWQRWQPAQIDRDFARISALAANAVRVVVEPDTFGYPAPSPLYVRRLAIVVGLAAAHGLHVELTLFDWWRRYGELPQSEQWARSLLAPYAGDDRIAAIELRNELDPNDATAVSWARAMLPFLRAVAGGIPVTISVGANGGSAALGELKQELGTSLPDFWSFHYYGLPELALGAFAAAAAVVAPQPLFVGETGYTNADSDPSVRSEADREDAQLHYFRTVGAAARMLGLPPVAPWILYDLAPSASPVRLAAQEYHFGLYRTDGVPKPVVGAIRSLFGGASLDASFNAGFELRERGAVSPLPSLWRHHGAGAFALDASVAHGGRSSASIGAGGGGATVRANFSTTPPVPWVASGVATSVSVWVRGLAATGTTTVAIRYYDDAGSSVAASTSAPLPLGTTGWTLLTADGVAPPGAVYYRIVLGSDRNTGRAWFDDVAVGSG